MSLRILTNGLMVPINIWGKESKHEGMFIRHTSTILLKINGIV